MGKNTSKIRLYDLAKELKIDTKRLIEEVRKHGVSVSVPSNAISKGLAEFIRSSHSRVKSSNTQAGRPAQTETSPTSITKQPSIVEGKRLYKREWTGPLPLNIEQSLNAEVRGSLNAIIPVSGNSVSKDASLEFEDRQRRNVCPICDKLYSSRKALRTHALQVHHQRLTSSGRVRKPLRLVYTPVQTTPTAAKASKVAHKRICPVCEVECRSRPGRRRHILSAHLTEVIDGKFLGKVKPGELSVVLGVDQKEVEKAARQIGLIGSSVKSLSVSLLKELVHKIELGGTEPDVLQNSSRASETIVASVPQDKTPSEQAHSINLSAEILDKVTGLDFGELRRLIDDCLKGRQVCSEQQSLFTTDPATLRDYAQILETKVRARSNSPSYKIVARILEDIEIFEKRNAGFVTTKINWKILPPGKHPFQKIVEHFQRISKHRRDLIVDMNRLHKAFSLGPEEVFVGTDEFEGYVVFYFASAETAVLDCPVIGNAIYVFGENWKSLSRLTKSQLLSAKRPNVERIIHSGAWFSRLRSLVTTRRLNANLNPKKL